MTIARPSLYLAFLVFRNAKSKNVDRKVRLFRNSVLMILVTCCFDWICLFGFAYNGFASANGLFVFVNNLVTGFSAAHIATIALVLINLQHLALDHVFEERAEAELQEIIQSPVMLLDVVANAKKEEKVGPSSRLGDKDTVLIVIVS